MIAGLSGFRERRVHAELERDPELLEHELWRIFEVDDGDLGGLAVADAAYHEDGGWSHALRELAAAGALDRARLLDASLEALSRDFTAHRTSWHTRFHEQLEPSGEERAARVEGYLGLLTSQVPPTVTFAVRALGRTHLGSVSAERLISALPAALASDRKGVVKDAIALLDRLVKDAPELAGACALAAAGALQHEAPDVQERALAQIARWTAGAPDEDVRVELLAYTEVVAATVRPRFEALVAGPSPEPTASSPDASSPSRDHAFALAALEARAAALPASIAGALAVPAALAAARSGRPDPGLSPLPASGEPVLDDADRLEPPAGLDELGDLLARLIESPGAPPEDFELALDGVARLCGTREPFARELAPLVKRIEATGAGWLPIGRVVLAWASGHVPAQPPTCRRQIGVDEFLHARAAEVAERAAALRPSPLLATPTHRGGWIEPGALVARVAALEGQAPRFDLVQALHRLAPDGRAAALAACDGLEGAAAAALRYALGGPRAGGEPFAAIAAWAIRAEPGEAPPKLRFMLRGPRPVMPTRPRSRLATVTEPPAAWPGAGSREPVARLCVVSDPGPPAPVLPQPTAWIPALQSSTRHRWERMLEPRVVRHLRLVWPGGAEVFFTCAAQHLADWGENGGASSEASPFFEPLLDPLAAAPPLALAALVLGLGADHPMSAAAAADALAAAVQDGRVTFAGLRVPLRTLLAGRHVKAGRLGPRLAGVAVHSPLHAEVVREALEGALSGEAAGSPRDLHALLEPLNELCAQAGAAIAAPEARALLSGFSGRSKTARLAQALLEREGNSRLAPAAALLAAEARVRRGEAWASK